MTESLQKKMFDGLVGLGKNNGGNSKVNWGALGKFNRRDSTDGSKLTENTVENKEKS